MDSPLEGALKRNYANYTLVLAFLLQPPQGSAEAQRSRFPRFGADDSCQLS